MWFVSGINFNGAGGSASPGKTKMATVRSWAEHGSELLSSAGPQEPNRLPRVFPMCFVQPSRTWVPIVGRLGRVSNFRAWMHDRP